MLIYCLEAKQRIAQLGTAEISNFIDSVPAKIRQKEALKLPSVPGFRKESALEIKERYKKLLITLTHPSEARFRADGPEWVTLGNIWACWAKMRFGSVFELPDPPPGEHDLDATLKFFEGLIKNCGDEGCSREDVNQLLRFSGFRNCPQLDALVAGLPTQEIVEQRRKYARLPAEVTEIREQLVGLDGTVQDALKVLEGFNPKLLELTKNLESTVDRTNGLVENLKTIDGALTGFEITCESRLQNFSRELTANVNASTEQARQITAIEKNVKTTNAALSQNTDQLRKFETALLELQASVDLLSESISASKQLADVSQNTFNGLVNTPKIVRRTTKDIKVVLVTEAKSALAVIASNLNAVGIQLIDANEVAKAVLCAGLAGQLIQITGSLSELIAEAICISLGGGDYITWEVPLGLCDGEQTSRVIHQMSNGKNRPHCLHIRGINKSAFEIYGDDLRHIVLGNQLGLAPNTNQWPMIATWAEGPATLTGGVPLMSLGPIIDSDKLQWSRAKPEKSKHAYFDLAAIESSLKNEADHDELSDLVKDIERLVSPIDQLRSRVIWKTVSYLLSIPEGNGTIAFGLATVYWAFPWLKISGISKEKATALIRKLCPGAQDITSIAIRLTELPEESAA